MIDFFVQQGLLNMIKNKL